MLALWVLVWIVRSAALALVSEVEAQLGHRHLPAETHHLPEHLLRWSRARGRRVHVSVLLSKAVVK